MMIALIVVFMIPTASGLMPDRQIVEQFATLAECLESRKQYVLVGDDFRLLRDVPIPSEMLYCTPRFADIHGGVRM